MLLTKHIVSVVCIVLFMAIKATAAGVQQPQAEVQHTHRIKGRVVTGTNRFLGQPLTDFGAPLGTAGFSNVAAQNSYGAQPIPLTTDTPSSALLATYVDPMFLSLIGKTPADVDPAQLNVLLQDVPVNVDPAGSVRSSLKGILQAVQMHPSLAEPSAHITLAHWVHAEGVASITCQTEEMSTVAIKLKNFLPNRIYTMWAILGGAELVPLPLGGVPNAIVTNNRGNARFERVLKFCPFQTRSGDRPLLLIDVVFHSDQQVYGAVPDLPFADLFTGLVNHTQYEFPLMGTSVGTGNVSP